MYQCLADSVVSAKSRLEGGCILLASNVFYPTFNQTPTMDSSSDILYVGNTSNCDTEASQLQPTIPKAGQDKRY